MTGRSQAVRLPKQYRFKTKVVTVRRDGEKLILEPVKESKWPSGFWDKIKIKDRTFKRPPQGKTSPIAALDESS